MRKLAICISVVLLIAVIIVGNLMLSADEDVVAPATDVSVTNEKQSSVSFSIPQTVIDGREQQPTDRPVGRVRFKGRIF
ncbi:MAG: hypothetical protein CMI53_02465 [Parcubacteria group bacterium]|jgi:hypothetical protein|nr:hypothetical protein [Parcubacteria group bacterium]|tara:strand:- start:1717 stop:1953 length:237 start_codon:yes stop_codon:yes gene_type:complete